MSIAQLELIANNRPGPHCEQVGVRYSVLDSAVADFKRRLDEALNAPCPNCGAHEYVFEIDTRRDRPSDAALILNRMKRLRDEDARAAGQRECL